MITGSCIYNLEAIFVITAESWLSEVSVNPEQGWTHTTESSVLKLEEERKEKENRGKDLDDVQLYPTPPPCSATWGKKYVLFGWTQYWEKQYCPKTKTRTKVLGLDELAQLLHIHHQWAHPGSTSTRIWNTCWQVSAYAGVYCKKSHRNIDKYLGIKRKCRKN